MGHLNVSKVKRHGLSNSDEILLSLSCDLTTMNNFES